MTHVNQDKHDTLIERLNKEMLYSVEMSKNSVFPENRDNFERLSSLFFDTLERLKQSQWTPIEDNTENALWNNSSYNELVEMGYKLCRKQ